MIAAHPGRAAQPGRGLPRRHQRLDRRGAQRPVEAAGRVRRPGRGAAHLDAARHGARSASSSPARCPRATAREIENARALQELGPTGFYKLLPLRTKGRISTVPRGEGPVPVAAGPHASGRSAPPSGARSGSWRASRLPGAPTPTPRRESLRAPAAARTCGASGASGARGTPAARRRQRLPVQRPPARLLDPRAVRGVRAALARAEHPRRERGRRPGAGHRPQRAAGVGLHLRPLGRGRPLRRVAHRSGDLPLQGPRRARWSAATSASTSAPRPPTSRTCCPSCCRAPGRSRARAPSASAAPSTGRCRCAPNGVAYARRYAIWDRELETLVGLSALNDAHDRARGRTARCSG